MSEIKTMTAAEFQESGLLQEVNRMFLHPLGVALSVVTEKDGSSRMGPIWDYRDDPEGLMFHESTFDDPESFVKAEFVRGLRASKAQERIRLLGSLIQAIPGFSNVENDISPACPEESGKPSG